LKNPQSKAKHCKALTGITDTTTPKLDLDNVSYKTAKYWAFKILRLFKSKSKKKWTPNTKIDLEGFLIVKSSPKHYHIIYNRSVEWLENLNVIAWTCLLSHKTELMKWLVMQIIKGSSTLRIGKKFDKPAPRVVFRFGKQDGEIKAYLKFRRENHNV
jgi:hypothetical protein